MKIIKVESCKDCPYRLIGYSYKDGSWKVKCTKLGKGEHKILSTSQYDKDKLDYTIPDECPLESVVE